MKQSQKSNFVNELLRNWMLILLLSYGIGLLTISYVELPDQLIASVLSIPRFGAQHEYLLGMGSDEVARRELHLAVFALGGFAICAIYAAVTGGIFGASKVFSWLAVAKNSARFLFIIFGVIGFSALFFLTPFGYPPENRIQFLATDGLVFGGLTVVLLIANTIVIFFLSFLLAYFLIAPLRLFRE